MVSFRRQAAEGFAVLCTVSDCRARDSSSRTQVQFEARIQAKGTAVPHDVRHGLQRSLVLIASCYLVAFGMRAILPVGQEDRHLRAQFRELERTCKRERVCQLEAIQVV